MTIIGLVIITFILASIVIVAGFVYSEEDFIQGVLNKDGIVITHLQGKFNWQQFISASGILFASFIGFDSIAQAGGEAKNPSKSLPRAIIITIVSVSLFYLLFTLSVYKIAPGMTLIAEIVVGKRSVISYLLWPFAKAMDEAMEEP